jgi:hypothetical protein
MHTNQLQEFNITTGGIVAKMTLNAIKNIGMKNMVKVNLPGIT